MTSLLNSRRRFIKRSGTFAAGLFLSPHFIRAQQFNTMDTSGDLKISLAEWSLHRAIQSGELTNLDFAHTAQMLGIHGIEYVSRFFDGRESDGAYLEMLNNNAMSNKVKQLLIMVDDEGSLGDSDKQSRTTAVRNHYKWVQAARELGCHSIRVNANGEGSADVVHRHVVDGLSRLSEYAAKYDINVIVENHGGLSSNAAWLMEAINGVNMPNCGTLPDFGNFCIRKEQRAEGEEFCAEAYDRYQGIAEMLPRAEAVSAKSYHFDSDGNETTIDFGKMIELVKASGYKGYIGIEYEGDVLGEIDGIKATKALLERYI